MSLGVAVGVGAGRNDGQQQRFKGAQTKPRLRWRRAIGAEARTRNGQRSREARWARRSENRWYGANKLKGDAMSPEGRYVAMTRDYWRRVAGMATGLTRTLCLARLDEGGGGSGRAGDGGRCTNSGECDALFVGGVTGGSRGRSAIVVWDWGSILAVRFGDLTAHFSRVCQGWSHHHHYIIFN